MSNEVVPNYTGRLVPSRAMTRRALRAAAPQVEGVVTDAVVAGARLEAAEWVTAEGMKSTVRLAELAGQVAAAHPELREVLSAYLGSFAAGADQAIRDTAVGD
jgi:hypothetical protein